MAFGGGREGWDLEIWREHAQKTALRGSYPPPKKKQRKTKKKGGGWSREILKFKIADAIHLFFGGGGGSSPKKFFSRGRYVTD